MNSKELKKNVAGRIKELDNIEKKTAKRMEKCPDGNLTVRNLHGNNRYLHVTHGISAYLGAQEEDKIKALEEKVYLQKLNRAARAEKESLEKVEKILEKVEDAESVFLTIPAERRHLIKPMTFVADEEIVARFEKEDFPETKLKNSTYTTIKGDKVRSKSELIIADRLTHFGVPYVYEPPTMVEEKFLGIWHPDFLCLNKKTGETFYWEHFGMLDNPEYCKSFQYKLEKYAEIGVYPGKNLIVTTESSAYQLNTEYVDKLIKHYLV